jgi:hypothetical protein
MCVYGGRGGEGVWGVCVCILVHEWQVPALGAGGHEQHAASIPKRAPHIHSFTKISTAQPPRHAHQ